jgi:TPR repeat protein
LNKNSTLSPHYFKLAADQGSTEGQIEHAEWILRGDGVPGAVPRRESNYYFRLAFAQGDCRVQVRLRVGLLSGLFGRFD